MQIHRGGRVRLAGILLALVVCAAPALAIAATGCLACCCPPQPCLEAAGGCAELSAATCCEQAQLTPLPVRSLESSPPALWLRPGSSSPPDASPRLLPQRAADLAARLSPLRLSVVRQN